MAKITLLSLFAASVFSAFGAEKVSFEIAAPTMVSAGEPFRVEFSLNAKPDEGTFRAPSFDGFDVVAGPASSEGHSVQIVNGSMSRTYNLTYTFVLLPREAGIVTIDPAEVEVDGTTYRTRPTPVEVVRETDDDRAESAAAASQDRGRNAPDVQGKVGRDDVLLRAIVSRTSVYKGEPLRVTFKLYERVPVVGYDDVKFPSFNGFWAQELDLSNARRQQESYNGKVYQTLVAREFLLYPQQAGTLTIDPAELTAMVQVVVQNRNRRADPFGFMDGPDIYNVPCKVQSPRLNVTVMPLPAGAPASFTGAVGSFAMDATLPPERLAANSAATYTVKISGAGNLAFVQAPKLTLPGSFEQYNVKTIESINASPSGISGYRQFEYPFIARAEGDYEVAPVEFTYFDPARVQYVTLHSNPLALEITPDGSGGGEAVVMQGRGMSKEEVRLLGQDIRFIRIDRAQLRAVQAPLFFSAGYWTLLGAVAVVFVAAYLLLRKRIRESRNAVLVRGRRASKVAVQRFRVARKYMEQQDRHAFYEEMLRALWGYMSDRFNIPVANLTKENVREELHKRGVSVEEQTRFTAIISQCDEAQYSPAATAQMNEVYSEGVDLISRIEGAIKR